METCLLNLVWGLSRTKPAEILNSRTRPRETPNDKCPDADCVPHASACSTIVKPLVYGICRAYVARNVADHATSRGSFPVDREFWGRALTPVEFEGGVKQTDRSGNVTL